jgi:hypothetical protein
LIGAVNVADENNLDNVFTTSSKPSEVYSLSMYSHAKTFIGRHASQVMQSNWLKSVENLHPVPEEAGAQDNTVDQDPFPTFKVPADLLPVSKDSIEAYKLQYMQEVESIKTRLDADNVP